MSTLTISANTDRSLKPYAYLALVSGAGAIGLFFWQSLSIAAAAAGGAFVVLAATGVCALRTGRVHARILGELGAAAVAQTGTDERIRAAARAILAAAQQLADRHRHMLARSETQAAHARETLSRLSTMIETVQSDATHAAHTHRITDSAATAAKQGNSAMSTALHNIGELERGAVEIGEIVATINGIALQTNILALNAAVEAARAGESGRGFAVVASEVRNLAQRSATAAKSIGRLVEQAAAQTHAGRAAVATAAEAMDDVVTHMQLVTELIAEVAQGGERQRQGIDVANRALTRIAGDAAENVAALQDSHAAADSIADQARNLNTTTSEESASAPPSTRVAGKQRTIDLGVALSMPVLR